MSAVGVLPGEESKRIDGIDLLRGVSIFFVIMNHVNVRLRVANVAIEQGTFQSLIHALIWNAQYGVQIFFAVSGFLITSNALRRWSSLSSIDLRRFYRLRFARIAPLLLLLLFVLSCLHLMQVKNFVLPARSGGLGRVLFSALALHLNWLEGRRGYLPWWLGRAVVALR